MALLTTDLANDLHEVLDDFRGLEPAKKLFWEELGYDRVNQPFPRRFIPEQLHAQIVDAVLFAEYEGFYIVYVRVARENLQAKLIRPFVLSALKHFPFAAFLFSDLAESDWQFVYGRLASKAAEYRTLAHFDLDSNEISLTRLANRLARLKTFDGNDQSVSLLALTQAYENVFGLAKARWERKPRQDFTPVELYLQDMGRFSLLDETRERELIERIESCGEVVNGQRRRKRSVPPEKRQEFYCCRNALMTANWRLSFHIAREFQTTHLDILDLAQEGCLGLARAAELIKGSHGTRFITYGYYWVKQCIRRAIQNHERTIRVPAHVYDELRQRKHRPHIMPQVKLVGSDLRKFERLSAGPRRSPLAPLLVDEQREVLQAAMARLRERDREVLELRFGLNGNAEHTLEEVGEIYDVTRERIRQIQERALARLRNLSLLNQYCPELVKEEEPEEPSDAES